MTHARNTKKSLPELLKLMDHEQAHLVESIHADHFEIITTIPGSSTKHQVWPGGLLSHLEETMNIAAVLYESLSSCRPLEFSLSDALLCAYLHDFDKVQRYRVVDGKLVRSGSYDPEYVNKTIAMVRDTYGYTLSPAHINALKYTHGENQDYHPTERIMLPLATLVHCADVISARIWFDEGKDSTSW